MVDLGLHGGDIQRVLAGERLGRNLVLQCVGVQYQEGRPILALSDGVHWAKAASTPEIAQLVTAKQIVDGTILQVANYLVQPLVGMQLIVLLDIQLLGRRSKIGQPKKLLLLQLAGLGSQALDSSPGNLEQGNGEQTPKKQKSCHVGALTQHVERQSERAPQLEDSAGQPDGSAGPSIQGTQRSSQLPFRGQRAAPISQPVFGNETSNQVPSPHSLSLPSLTTSSIGANGVPNPTGQTLEIPKTQLVPGNSQASQISAEELRPGSVQVEQPGLLLQGAELSPRNPPGAPQKGRDHSTARRGLSPDIEITATEPQHQQNIASSGGKYVQMPSSPTQHGSAGLISPQQRQPVRRILNFGPGIATSAGHGPSGSSAGTDGNARTAGKPGRSDIAESRTTAQSHGNAGPAGTVSPPENAGMARNSGSAGIGGSGRGQPYVMATPPSSQLPSPQTPAALKTIPLATLSPWHRNWTVKVKVLTRSEMREWAKETSRGRYFTAALVDVDGGEMKAVAFNEIADRLHDLMVPGSVVLLSKAALKPARSGAGYEMTLDLRTTVQICQGEQLEPSICYQFRPLEKLDSLAVNSTVDVAGIVCTVAAAYVVNTKYGSTTRKRSITLKDDSMCTIELTLWGETADSIGAELEQIHADESRKAPVLAVKSSRLSEWFGPILATTESTRLAINPDHPRAHHLRDWFDEVGSSYRETDFRELSRGRQQTTNESKTVADALAVQPEEGSSISMAVSGCISYLDCTDFTMAYPACTLVVAAEASEHSSATRRCNKRLVENSEKEWWCESCNRKSEAEWRYRLQFRITDFTGTIACLAFEEAASKMLGVSAEKLHQLQQANEPEAEAICQAPSWGNLGARLRLSSRTWNNNVSTQAIVQSLWTLNYIAESQQLLNAIRELKKEANNCV